MTLQEWVNEHYKIIRNDLDLTHYRLGQAFANEFRNEYYFCKCGVGSSEIGSFHDKDLFYVENDKEALQMIMEWLSSKDEDYFEQLTKDL